MTVMVSGGEEFDTIDMFDEGTSVYTIPRAGLYVVSANVQWSPGTGSRGVFVFRNNAQTGAANVNAAVGSGLDSTQLYDVMPLEVGEQIQFKVIQESGAPLSTFGTRSSVHWLGRAS